MAIYKSDIVDINLESGSIHRSFLSHTIGSGDDDANRFGVRAFRNGTPESLSGICTGYFIRADGETVVISNGTISGNKATVTLPEACYVVEGQFALAIKVSNGGVTTTMRIIDGVVNRTTTSVIVDPGTIIPSIEDLIQAIDDAIEGIPQDYSMLSVTAETNGDADTGKLFPNLAKKQIIKNYISDSILEGTHVSGKAWRKNGTETSGSEQYCYTRYEGSGIEDSIGSFLIVSGYTWAENWPLICFYNSSNTLLATYGNDNGGTPHVYNFIPVPKNTSYCMVNGKTDAYDPEVATIGATDLNRLLSGAVMPFGVVVNADFVTANPNYNYVRNWPTNAVYNLQTGLAGVVLDLPEVTTGTNTLATLVKFNGSKSQTATGFSQYIYSDIYYNAYVGFDNGASIHWMKVTNNAEDIQLGMGYITPTSVTTGKARNKDGTEAEQASYRYGTFDASGLVNKVILISGWHFANSYPVYMVCDSNGDLITYSSLGNSGMAVRQLELKVPANAATIYVNGLMQSSTGGRYPSIQTYDESVTLNDLYRTHKKRRYLFIGDSYCEGYSHDGSNSGWAVYCAGYMGLTSDDYVRKYKGGARFSANGSNNTYQALLYEAQYPFDYFTDIVVCGGYNDNAYTEENIKAGISGFITLAKSMYPEARIHIGFVAWNKAGNGSGAIDTWETINAALTGTVLPTYQKCVEYGVDYLSNVEYWLNNDGLTPSDGYHPSETGNRSIARAVANALLTGSAPLPYNADLRL